MAKTSLTINVQIEGLRETMRAFRDLPQEASTELRDASGLIANDMVTWIKNAAMGDSAQSAAVAGTTKAVRDRVPVVQIGGAKKVTSSKAAAYKILFGANFGSRTLKQFRSWAGVGNDYFIFKNIDQHRGEIEARWLDAADAAIRKWSQSEGVLGDG